MNTTIKDMLERRSIRKFKSDMVPRDLIDEVIGALCGEWKGEIGTNQPCRDGTCTARTDCA